MVIVDSGGKVTPVVELPQDTVATGVPAVANVGVPPDAPLATHCAGTCVALYTVKPGTASFSITPVTLALPVLVATTLYTMQSPGLALNAATSKPVVTLPLHVIAGAVPVPADSTCALVTVSWPLVTLVEIVAVVGGHVWAVTVFRSVTVIVAVAVEPMVAFKGAKVFSSNGRPKVLPGAGFKGTNEPAIAVVRLATAGNTDVSMSTSVESSWPFLFAS